MLCLNNLSIVRGGMWETALSSKSWKAEKFCKQ